MWNPLVWRTKKQITPAVIELNEFTPDLAVIQEKETHLYFAYHTTDTNYPGFVENGVTRENFQLWKRDDGKLSFPIATPRIPQMCRTPALPVRGRILLISTEQMIQLDEYARNGVEFVRKRITVHTPLFKETKERDFYRNAYNATVFKGEAVVVPEGGRVRAWTHIGVLDHWADKLDGGYKYKQVRYFEPNNRSNKPYYMFTKMELNE